MYFSLVPDPGYNLTFLEENGFDGEWAMFKGEFMPSGDNGTGMAWGGLTSYIEGTSLTLSLMERCLEQPLHPKYGRKYAHFVSTMPIVLREMIMTNIISFLLLCWRLDVVFITVHGSSMD